jgi:hypothetical protein
MDIGHLITIVLAAGSGLTAAIGIMYRTIITMNKDQANIREELGQMKGRQEGIEHLSREVLQTVHNAVKKRNENHNYTTSSNHNINWVQHNND